jgi:hypothetical protein
MAHYNRVALIAGANPRKCKEGPVVRLPLGKWLIGVHGKIDSEIAVYVGGVRICKLHDGCEINVTTDPDKGVRVVFEKIGNEEFISINATKAA